MTGIVKIIAGISEIADCYDGFLVDLWGCVHNGTEPFPAAVDALLHLSNIGKRVCLLSNGPRRGNVLIERMDNMGVPKEAYHYVMSSGEATWQALNDRSDDFHAALGRRAYRIGPHRDASVHQDNGLEMVGSINKAEFILCTGPFDNADPLSDYEDMLMEAIGCNLPMVCANPDLVVHIGDNLYICGGTIAKRYEELGGKVAYHGKPHASVYRECFRLLDGVSKNRILGVGDALRTDVCGARNQGIDALFLTTGIHIDEIGSGALEADKVSALAASIGPLPTYAMPHLAW